MVTGGFTQQTTEGLLSWDASTNTFTVLKPGLYNVYYEIGLNPLPGALNGAYAVVAISTFYQISGQFQATATHAQVIAGADMYSDPLLNVVLLAGATLRLELIANDLVTENFAMLQIVRVA